MKIVRIDQGLAVQLPEATVHALDLHEGDEVHVSITRPPRELSPEEVAASMARLDALRGLMPADFKFDREEANAR